MTSLKESVTTFLKGVAMGAANVIPGVSGGTVAFITGIYERLINALKNLDFESVRLLLRGSLTSFTKRTDIVFLIILFVGVFVSIASLAQLLELAFNNYEVLTLAFFFGLILASIFAVARQITKVNVILVMAFAIGTGIAIAVAFLPPAQANTSFVYLMLCGIAAVCSMILPGLSGSYILLLMGNYILVLRAISDLNFSILLPLLLGCVIGLVTLSRLLSYLFAHFKNLTIGVLAGFVAGSLLIIWPWKTTLVQTFDGKEKAVGYVWHLPSVNVEFFLAFLFILVGYALVAIMERVGGKS